MELNISPIDSRYSNLCDILRPYISDFGINKIRYEVELKYLRFLLKLVYNYDLDYETITKLVNNFSTDDFCTLKRIELNTNHDIKALEYFIKDNIFKNNILDEKYIEMVHFGLTSQDINSVTNTLCLKRAIENGLILKLDDLLYNIDVCVNSWWSTPMISKTHGQSAVPTTMGKELKVFYSRLETQINKLKNITYSSKFGGAVGNMNAHYLCFENIDWSAKLTEFLKDDFDLKRNIYTTQIDHYDNLTEIFDILKRINVILLDFNQDIWLYISQNYFSLKIKSDEVGSSTMPHKVNPINFENSEGNLHLSNSLLNMFANKLPISRLQRDLTDSTVSRNFGSALSYCLIAYTSFDKGLLKLQLNEESLSRDLNENWSILMEAVQCVMKTEHIKDSYEYIKKLSRGKTITKETYFEIVNNINISKKGKAKLLALTPQTYLGFLLH
jgi:adenylosuccinate lyase